MYAIYGDLLFAKLNLQKHYATQLTSFSTASAICGCLPVGKAFLQYYTAGQCCHMFGLVGGGISGLYFAQFDKSDLAWVWFFIGGVFGSLFYLFFSIIRSNVIRENELEENHETSHKKIGYRWSELSVGRKIFIICLLIIIINQFYIFLSFSD